MNIDKMLKICVWDYEIYTYNNISMYYMVFCSELIWINNNSLTTGENLNDLIRASEITILNL